MEVVEELITTCINARDTRSLLYHDQETRRVLVEFLEEVASISPGSTYSRRWAINLLAGADEGLMLLLLTTTPDQFTAHLPAEPPLLPSLEPSLSHVCDNGMVFSDLAYIVHSVSARDDGKAIGLLDKILTDVVGKEESHALSALDLHEREGREEFGKRILKLRLITLSGEESTSVSIFFHDHPTTRPIDQRQEFRAFPPGRGSRAALYSFSRCNRMYLWKSHRAAFSSRWGVSFRRVSRDRRRAV